MVRPSGWIVRSISRVTRTALVNGVPALAGSISTSVPRVHARHDEGVSFRGRREVQDGDGTGVVVDDVGGFVTLHDATKCVDRLATRHVATVVLAPRASKSAPSGRGGSDAHTTRST
jgi:hypothetical protein